MTKLAILSDIHANLPALEAVMADMAQYGVNAVVVAGDVINGAPFEKQVVERVLENHWAVIRGNGEHYLLDYGSPRMPVEWHNKIEFPIPSWLHRQLDQDAIHTIASWPDTLSLRFPDAPTIRVVHGSPRSANDSLYPNLTDEAITEMLAGVEEDTVIAGHTHLPMNRQIGKWHLLNPGSVGLPLDGNFTAAYMLLDGDERGWQATQRRIPFDYEPIYKEFERIGFVEECGVIGKLIIKVFKTARPQLYFLSWRREHYPDESISEAMLDEFFETCKWWKYAEPAYHVNM